MFFPLAPLIRGEFPSCTGGPSLKEAWLSRGRFPGFLWFHPSEASLGFPPGEYRCLFSVHRCAEAHSVLGVTTNRRQRRGTGTPGVFLPGTQILDEPHFIWLRPQAAPSSWFLCGVTAAFMLIRRAGGLTSLAGHRKEGEHRRETKSAKSRTIALSPLDRVWNRNNSVPCLCAHRFPTLDKSWVWVACKQCDRRG